MNKKSKNPKTQEKTRKTRKTYGKTQKPNYPRLFLEKPGFLPTLLMVKRIERPTFNVPGFESRLGHRNFSSTFHHFCNFGTIRTR
jgi:hypothetical protein